MRSGHRFVLWVAVLAMALASVACTVNEMPRYRNRIQNVHLAPRVDRTAEVIFVSPAVMDPSNPDSVALNVLEQRVRAHLGDRMASLAHPDLVEQTFTSALRRHFTRRFDWNLAREGEAYDTLFMVAMKRYGVSVNSAGASVVFFDTEITGRFVETGTLIYEQTVRSEVPLTALYQGYDPVSEAAARVYNLMALDQMSDGQFQAHLMAGVEQAAGFLMDELFDDTWR
jgi:hypothetical protein